MQAQDVGGASRRDHKMLCFDLVHLEHSSVPIVLSVPDRCMARSANVRCHWTKKAGRVWYTRPAHGSEEPLHSISPSRPTPAMSNHMHGFGPYSIGVGRASPV